MRHVRTLCLFCVASCSLTGFSMAQYPVPQNQLWPHHMPAAPHATTFATPYAATPNTPTLSRVPQPQPSRGRPINGWSTAPAAVYVSPFQNSPPVSSSPGFPFQPQLVSGPQIYVHGPMQPPADASGHFPNTQFAAYAPFLPTSHAQQEPFVNADFPVQQSIQAPEPQHFSPYAFPQNSSLAFQPLRLPESNSVEMQPASFPNSGAVDQSQPLSAGHSFQNVQQRRQTPPTAPIHVYPPNIRLKN